MALGHSRRVVLLGGLVALPGVLAAGAWAMVGDGGRIAWAVAAMVVAAAASAVVVLRRQVSRPLETLTNVVAALRESDFSVRYHPPGGGDALDHLVREVNALSSILREQRLGAAEATALLRQVMEEIDVAVLSFDGEGRVRLVNRAAERLFGQSRQALLGRMAADIGFGELLGGTAPRVFDAAYPGGAGRYELRRGTFRQEGLPQQLVVLSNLSHVLREEERQAWQRLIRVLGHELNNSLATIKSISTSLETLMERRSGAGEEDDDVRRGLTVIRGRAEALARFMEGYTRLARLPPPRPRPVDVRDMVERAARLETRRPVAVTGGPPLVVFADPDQVEQILINLLRNAAEAAGETGGGVSAAWVLDGRGGIEIRIDDEGPGLPAPANLFVPFFTTKPGGSGIGLVLSRQIAEAHGGSLVLEPREGGAGCRARLCLPSAAAEAAR